MSGGGYVLVLLTALMTMGANLMLRAGIDAAGGFAPGGALDLVVAVTRLFLQPLFTAGFVVYFLASVVWFRVIATEPLSIAYPILVSLTFSLVTAGAVAFFHESLSIQKVVGLATILAGIVIISIEKGGT
jgi:multidrug transporter EmrE-like cation transporter